ncbi:MAG: methyltransferase [Candidatus Micrarchaeota archaeon]|nr:methyltransferase [Candidatus Micrarchaeota archaeon]
MDYDGLEIEVPEGVYEPREDSALARRALKAVIESAGKKGLRVLDMGTGSGILGLSAASEDKVGDVVFSDIDERALSAARGNIERNRQRISARCSFVRSDIFSSINGNFDVMVFNAPYLPHSANDKGTESGAWDGGAQGVELSIRFLKGSLERLEDDGRILLVASSLGNMERLTEEIERMGLEIERSIKEHYFFEDIFALVIRKRR